MSKFLSVLVLIALTFGVVSAQETPTKTLSRGKAVVSQSTTQAVAPRDQDIVLSQSNSQAVEETSIACSWGDGWATGNSFARVYDLAAYPSVTGELMINQVEFGVGVADINVAATYIPITVSLHTLTGELTPANLTLLNATEVEVRPTDAGSILTVPLEAIVPNTAKVVVMVTSEDYGPGIIDFRIGGNYAGETGDSYLMECDQSGFTDYDEFALPVEDPIDPDAANFAYVLNLLGDLRTFSLLTPSNGLPVAEVSSVTAVTWEEYAGATSYEFILDRPTAENVTLTGTPAQDTDPLTCTGGECVLTVDGAAVLTEEGVYSWTVNATANSMVVSADNDPRTFVVDFAPLPFDIVAPGNDAIVTDPTTIGAITWNRAVNAAYYRFNLTRTSTNPRDLDLGVVLDFTVTSAEICNTTTNVCSLTLFPSEIALLTTGEYFWSVYAYNESGYEVQATNAPYGFSVITGETELVANGNFEALNATGGTLLSPWKAVRKSGDKIRCNTDTVTDVAHAGRCALVFKSSPTENSLFIQNLKPTLFVTGANVNLSAWVKSQNAANKLVQLVLTYEPEVEQPLVQKLKLDVPAGTTTYTELTTSGVVGEGTVKKVKLKLQFRGTAGRAYVDDVSVTVTGTTTTPPANPPVSPGLLPLPRSQR